MRRYPHRDSPAQEAHHLRLPPGDHPAGRLRPQPAQPRVRTAQAHPDPVVRRKARSGPQGSRRLKALRRKVHRPKALRLSKALRLQAGVRQEDKAVHPAHTQEDHRVHPQELQADRPVPQVATARLQAGVRQAPNPNQPHRAYALAPQKGSTLSAPP